jgi:hypothetical protein
MTLPGLPGGVPLSLCYGRVPQEMGAQQAVPFFLKVLW